MRQVLLPDYMQRGMTYMPYAKHDSFLQLHPQLHPGVSAAPVCAAEQQSIPKRCSGYALAHSTAATWLVPCMQPTDASAQRSLLPLLLQASPLLLLLCAQSPAQLLALLFA